MEFVPIILPEDTPPHYAQDYMACNICTAKSRLIWGEGNPQAPIMIVLDNPGAREDKDGKEYICGTRQTLQHAIRQTHLNLEDIYVTYLLKCRPRQKYDKEEARAFSKPFLIRQIKDMHPRYLVCLGNTVVQAMFNNNELSVKELRGAWHQVLGLPTMVSYHPLAARSMPNLMAYFLQDWHTFAQHFFGECNV